MLHTLGVLRYDRDGEVQSPFLGFKFVICRLFGLENFWLLFGVIGISKDSFWGLTKMHNSGFSFLYQTSISFIYKCKCFILIKQGPFLFVIFYAFIHFLGPV